MKKFIGGFVLGTIFGNIFKDFCVSIVCHEAIDNNDDTCRECLDLYRTIGDRFDKAVNKKIDIPETEPVEKTDESYYYALMWCEEFIKISKETFEHCEAEDSPVVNTSLRIDDENRTIHYHILLPDVFKKILTDDFAKNIGDVFMKTIGFDDAVYAGYYDENSKTV